MLLSLLWPKKKCPQWKPLWLYSCLWKYYRRPDLGNVFAELYGKGAYDRNNTFGLCCSVLEKAFLAASKENNKQHWSDRWKAHSTRKMHSIIINTNA